MKVVFEDKFDEVVLKRGYDYYLNDLVGDVKIDDDEITAIVYGSEEYDVSINIEEENLMDAYCDCPYDGKKFCKHIAALLYYLNNENLTSKPIKNGVSLEEIINFINEKDLRKFLFELLESDESALNKFRWSFIDCFPREAKSEYKSKIRNVISNIAGRNGFIDYDRSSDYSHSMYDFIREAEILIDNKEYEIAFDIVSLVLDEIPDLAIDDSGGDVSFVADGCIDIIEKVLNSCIIENSKRNIVEKILDYVLSEVETEVLNNYGIDEMVNIIPWFIQNNFCLEKIEEVLFKVIDNYDKKWSCNKRYYIEWLINILLLKNQDEKVLSLIENNLDDHKILLKYVDIKLEENKIDEAIKLIKSVAGLINLIASSIAVLAPPL